MFNRFALPAAAAAVTIITLLTGCAGASSTSTTPPASLGNHVRRHGSSCPCLYVANQRGPTTTLGSVTVYAAGATGNASPIQKLKISFLRGIAVDASGKMYVTSGASPPAVLVYAAGATGTDAPLRTISGSKTGLNAPLGIAVDPVNGDIYVANAPGPINGHDSVTIYAPDANGNVPPIGTIAGAKTGLSDPQHLALDPSGNIYVPNCRSTAKNHGTVTVYAAGSVGNVPPIQTITGLHRQLDCPTQVALNSNSKHIYVANLGGVAVGGHVAVYAASANGMARAIRLIAGSLTQLDGPEGIALDGSNNIYVANNGNSSVTVYAPGSGRNVAPINTISGSNTGLDFPVSLAIH